MPYIDASADDLRRSFGLAEGELPDAAILVGTLRWEPYREWLHARWPGARTLEERIVLVEGRHRIWFVMVFGAAMAATYAHLAVKLGARTIVQLGAMGGLQRGWNVGDVLVPARVIGRDGVSRQLSRNRPLETDAAVRAPLATALAASGLVCREGTLVTTTTIALERPMDIRRWARAGYAGVEMEGAATIAVARHFGVPAAGAFVLLDNLAADHTVFTLTDEDRRRLSSAREPMAEAAVDAIGAQLGGAAS